MQFYQLQPKQVMVCEAITDILKIFADNEIGGQYEINHDELCKYLDSLKYVTDYWDCETKEDVYNRFTEDIYAGLPVWRFLKLPEWTQTMVEKSFRSSCQKDFEELSKVYKCLTCKYHKVHKYDIGVRAECLYDKKPHSGRTDLSQVSHTPFEPKEQCDHYVKKYTAG